MASIMLTPEQMARNNEESRRLAAQAPQDPAQYQQRLQRAGMMGGNPMGTGMATFQQPQAMASQPAQQPQQQPQQAAPAPQRTFAQMQQQGQARPAPPPAAPSTPQYQQSQVGQQAVGMLQQQAQQLMAQPTRFDTQAFQQMRQAQAANLQSQYEEQQRQLNEDLSRRGLSASTIGAAGLGRLAGAQSRALADIDAQLLQQAAQTQMQDRLAAAGAAGQLAQLAEGQNLAAYQANLAGQGQGFGQQMQAAGFGEQQRQFDIQQALQRQLGLEGLGLQQQELAQRGQQFGQSLAEQQAARMQQGGLTQQEIDLRRTLGLGELTGQVGTQQTLASRQLAQQAEQAAAQRAFEAEQAGLQRTFAGGESQAERALRERLMSQGQTFEAAQAEAQRQFAGTESALERQLRQQLQTGAQTFETEQQRLQREFAGGQSELERALRERLQGQQITESAADRALRERLGLGELTGRIGGQETLGARQFAAQQAAQQNQLLVQLAGLMAGGSPELLQSVLARFGLGTGTPVTNTAAPAPTQTPAPTSTPTATPTATPVNPLGPIGSTTQIPADGSVSSSGLSPQALSQLSILQQMSFNPYSFYGTGF